MKEEDKNIFNARNSTAIDVQNLTISYLRKPAIRGIDLKIPSGKIVGIVGPNGAGKSTLLKGILGLLPGSSGKVLVSGRPVKENLSKISYIPQREIFDWDFPVTVFDVVMMGRFSHLGIFARPKKQDNLKVIDALTKVDMLDYKDRQIRNLSGGQQQRIFLARSLAQEAEILFLDEPFVGVDAATENAIFQLMKNLKNEGKTILVVHHDLGKVTEYFDYIALINQRLIAFGPTETTFTPELLNKTYGGRLTILQKSENLIGEK
jgi:manganese/zinc/iron transport system ATP- binding protein